MGLQTTLYAEDRNVVAAFDQDGTLDFGAGEKLCLDKSAPILSYLVGADTGMSFLYYPECLDVGDASIRSFSPESVLMLLRRISGGAILKNLKSVDWDSEIAGQVYPFRAQDKKPDCQNYILEHGSALQEFLEATARQGNGIISVEC